MRFFLDNDVDAGIASLLRRKHHQCWRIANTMGQSVWLHCQQVDAVEVLAEHVTEVEAKLASMPMVVLEVTREGVELHPPQWE